MPTSTMILKVGKSLYDNGENLVGSTSSIELAKITLQVDKEYVGLDVSGHCRTGTIFDIIYNDNGTEISKGTIGSDPGMPTPSKADKAFTLDTSGKTGTQELILKFKNLNTSNCTRGSISTTEFSIS